MTRPVVLVTNASGFAGPPASAAMLAAGYRVFVHDSRFDDEQAWQRFAADHPGAERAGGAAPEDRAPAVERIAGRLDAVICNDHHSARPTSTEALSIERARDALEALVVAPLAVIKGAIAILKRQGKGNVVMVTSNRTRLPFPRSAASDAGRAAANALVRSLAIELAPDRIAVNAVAPNFLESAAYYPHERFVADPAGRAYLEANVPAGRLGEPGEIGEVIRFLATTEARFLTGAILDFSGGWPAAPPLP